MKRCNLCGASNENDAVICKTCHEEFIDLRFYEKRNKNIIDGLASVILVLGIIFSILDYFRLFVNMLGVSIFLIGSAIFVLNSKNHMTSQKIRNLENKIRELEKKIEE